MKNVKLLLFTIFTTLFIPTMANAATEMPIPDADGVIKLTENVELGDGYVIGETENITIDLNGYNITNTANTDTIYVELGGKLTIQGEGKISNTTGKASLFNNGTVIINGGTFEQDGFTNRYYVILNHGIMTINKATIKMYNEDLITSGSHPSLIANGYSNYSKSTDERVGYVENVNQAEPTLTINDGTFDGGLNTVKNDDNGILEINGGTFQNTFQVSLMNWNKATINGGTFETPTGQDKTNIFVGNYGADSVDKGILVINGGTFNAENTLEGYVVTPVEINGGTFNYTKGLVNQDSERTTDNLSKDVVEIAGGTFASDDVTPAEGYTKYQVSENEYVVASTIEFDVTTENIELEVGGEKVINVAELVKKYGQFTSSDETVATLNGNVIKALKEGKATITVTFNGQVKNINLQVIKSPKTGDNILIYLVIAFASIIGLSVCGLYLKKELANNK